MSARDWSAPKWVNTEPDTGAVGALLARLAEHVAPDTIDELWLFPTRRGGGIESTVVVLATFTEDADRRDVLTARFTVSRDKKGRASVEDRIDSHATAPATAVGRVVDGVLRRLGDDAAHPPRLERIAGNDEKFRELVVELGGPAETEHSTTTPIADPDSDSNPSAALPGPESPESASAPDAAASDASAPDPGSDSNSDSASDSASVSDSAPASASSPVSASASDSRSAPEGVARDERIGYQ